MKAFLANVPPWYPNQPYLSIPLLTGILRREGYKVYQRDINLAFFNTLLSKKELLTQFSLINYNSLSEKEKYLYNLKDYFINNVSSIKSKIRNIKYYKKKKKLRELFEDLDLILKTYQLNFDDIDIKLGQFEFSFNYFNPNNILTYINNRDNLFSYYFKKYEVENLITISPDICGISITTPEQFIPSLSFIQVVKKYLPTSKILLGGDYISRICKKYIRHGFLVELFDFILVEESEETIKMLFNSVGKNEELNKIPGLIWKNKYGEVVFNKGKIPLKYDNSVYPDFDGLELDQYFTPRFVIPIEASKGCYWGRCKFCEIKGKQYLQKTAQHLFDEIKYLSTKYRTIYFTIVSSAPSPKLLKNLSELVIQQNIEIFWSVMLRPEDYIDNKFVNILYKGGIRLAMLGIESGNQKILTSMNKGLNVSKNETIIRLLNNEGVFVHTYFMFNYKNETLKQQNETVAFIERNSDFINSLSVSNYVEPCFGENDSNDFNIYQDGSNKNDGIEKISLFRKNNNNYQFHINTYLLLN